MRDFLPGFNVSSDMIFAKSVLLLDDCLGTFNWIATGTGGDDVHEYATGSAFMTAKGMHLKTRATGAAADDNLFVSRFMGWPASGLVVWRLRFALVDSTKVSAVQLNLFLRDGFQTFQAQVLYAPNTPQIYYLDDTGAPVAMGLLPWNPLNSQWVGMELVVDASAMQYLQVMANGIGQDLEGKALYNVGASAYRACDVQIGIVAIGASPAEVNFSEIYVGEFLGA